MTDEAQVELAKFKQKRASLRSALTRFRKFIEDNDLNNLSDIIYNDLKNRLSKFEPNYDEFDKVQVDISCVLEKLTLTPDQRTQEMDEKNYFDDYFKLVAQARTAIDKYEKAINEENVAVDLESELGSGRVSSPGSHRSSHFHNNVSGSNLQARLPSLKVPTFSGHMEKWLEFKDAFLAIVETNFNLPAVQKLQYLKSACQGEAEELIASLAVTSNNYDVAWSLLTERYENNRLIIDTYIQGLLDAPVLTRESYSDLRKLFDTFNKNIRCLTTLNQPTDTWDTLLIAILVNKFDSQTRREWEAYPIQGDFPIWSEVNSFLKNKCLLLEKLELTKTKNATTKQTSKFDYKDARQTRQRGTFMTTKQAKKFSCYYCKANHSIFECDGFKKLSVNDRNSEARKLKLCLNCFNPNHNVQDCPKSSCRVCNLKHNSLLHRDNNKPATDGLETTGRDETATVSAATTSFCTAAGTDNAKLNADFGSCGCENLILAENLIPEDMQNKIVSISGVTRHNSVPLLSTALVNITGTNNKTCTARLLVDPGSQSNFITANLSSKLGLELRSVNFAVSGVGDTKNLEIKYQTNVTINSRVADYRLEISCLILNKITSPIPSMSFPKKSVKIPKGIPLADPNFNISSEIDILLGVQGFYDILLMDQIKTDNYPTLQRTQLGWLVGGELQYLNPRNQALISCLAIDNNLNDTLLKFWQIEEPRAPEKSSNDFCERHFLETHERDSSGRFIVKIPFKDNLRELGDSKQAALRSLDYLDKRMSKNLDLKKEYAEFISEYENLGHMTELKCESWQNRRDNESYYLPHHAVIKASSVTCHLRVVFNASSKTTSGLSLNDVQHAGPVIQKDLVSILTRFRKHKYVLSADVSKMYRQILIHPDHRPYQRILWTGDTGDIKCFELNTVVYGMTSSPFLAVRCLHQVASEHEIDYPLAAHVIKTDFYMDDLLTGTNNETELLTLQRDITTILASIGFDLRKWLSNKKDFCEQFQINDKLQASILQLGENEQNKTLGIFWNAYTDSIQYRIKDFTEQSTMTKRKILSISSQIFDPLGLVQPVIVVAKLIIQSLWKEKSDWDADVSDSLLNRWNSFCLDMKNLNKIEISRRVFSDNYKYVELHAFADASERAYGAALYVRCVNYDGTYSSHLLCAKSKVAPTSQPTLPRLELTAALTAARLTGRVLDTIDFKFDRVYYWSDSTVSLCWIKGMPDRWKPFVKNRVVEIQTLTNPNDWFHVRTEHNPADLVSRGCTALSLLSSELWFHGPSWLKSRELPLIAVDVSSVAALPEQRVVSNISTIQEVKNFDLFSRYSSFSKLQRIAAFCYRFINNSRARKIGIEKNVEKNLTALELDLALHNLIRIAQIQSFGQIYFDLLSKKPINKTSTIRSLNPFMDTSNLLRVGGRMQQAKMDFSKKFPIILHNKHKLTRLIFEFFHKTMLHCGPQQLLYTVRQKYWSIAGRSLARSVVHSCVICFKVKPKTCDYLMGNLPHCRVNPFIPFVNTGCDYAGPFMIKDRKTRNPKLTKAYICIFICMTVKAVHLELVTDLTSDAFLAAFKRFISRRGKPHDFYCDNGTTFVGASSEISKFLRLASPEIGKRIISEGINFHFIPPRAPNFGGLWESGVKSCKSHLKRVIGNTHLHYEDFMTVLTQTEAVLNSRPLSPMSSDVDDYTPLSPGHFLIGRPITSLPEPCVTQVPENRLTHFKRLQQILQHFWRRWSREYISELQTRQKWFQDGHTKLKVDDLVLVKEDNLPPLKWRTARVLELHPGSDDITRVVTIRFSDGSKTKRAITKLCLLPISDNIH